MGRDEAWHTEEHVQDAPFCCRTYERAARSVLYSGLSVKVYTTWVSNAVYSQPTRRGDIVFFLETSRPPPLAWIKMFIQAFGFGTVQQNEAVLGPEPEAESNWGNVMCRSAIEVEVRVSRASGCRPLHPLPSERSAEQKTRRVPPQHRQRRQCPYFRRKRRCVARSTAQGGRSIHAKPYSSAHQR